MHYIGIDISDSSFHAAKLDMTTKTYQVKQWSYRNQEDLTNFAISLDKDQDYCVMEATGVYHLRLAYYLVEQGYKVSIVNPLSVKRYRQMKSSITKTDKADAIYIAQYAVSESEYLKQYVIPQETLLQLSQRRTLLNSLQNQLQVVENQLHALSRHPKPDVFTVNFLEQNRTLFKQQIQEVQKAISQIIDQDYNQQKELLLTIPGFGQATATVFIETLNPFQGIENDNAAKAFSKFVGLAPTIQESGKSVRKKANIARSSAPLLRAKLYLPAMTVCTRCKEPNVFKTFYLKLRNDGKSFKEAIGAVMHKMVRIAVAVIKSNTPFKKDYLSTSNITNLIETK